METGALSAAIRDSIIPAIRVVDKQIQSQQRVQQELKETLERFSAESQVISEFLGTDFDLNATKAVSRQRRLLELQKRIHRVQQKLGANIA